jgi:hypothetical protein
MRINSSTANFKTDSAQIAASLQAHRANNTPMSRNAARDCARQSPACFEFHSNSFGFPGVFAATESILSET